MTLTPAQEFDQLLNTFERNSNTGSLKAANGTLVKILRLMWTQIGSTPETQAALDVLSDSIKGLHVAADANLARLAEPETTDPVAVALAEAIERSNETAEPIKPITADEGSEPSEDDAASAEETARPKRNGRPAKG